MVRVISAMKKYNALISWSIDRLSKCVPNLQERLSMHGSDAELSESETEYPLTPPPSDYSDSRPLSPSHRPNITIIHVPQHTPGREARNLQKLGKGRPYRNSSAISNVCSLNLLLSCRKRHNCMQRCSNALPCISTFGQTCNCNCRALACSNPDP